MFQQSGEFSAHTVSYWQEANFDLALVKVNTIHSHTFPIKLWKYNVHYTPLQELKSQIFNTCNEISA